MLGKVRTQSVPEVHITGITSTRHFGKFDKPAAKYPGAGYGIVELCTLPYLILTYPGAGTGTTSRTVPDTLVRLVHTTSIPVPDPPVPDLQHNLGKIHFPCSADHEQDCGNHTHLTLGPSIAQYVKGAEGLWPRG